MRVVLDTGILIAALITKDHRFEHRQRGIELSVIQNVSPLRPRRAPRGGSSCRTLG